MRFLFTTFEGGGHVPAMLVVAHELRRRGHAVTVADAWANGRHCAAKIDVESGVMSAGASPRSAYAYAIGR